jgi:hypothetical protein
MLGTWLGPISFKALPRLIFRLSDEYLHGWSRLLPKVPGAAVRMKVYWHITPHQVHVHLVDTWIFYRYHWEGTQGFLNTTLLFPPLSPLHGHRPYKEFWSYCGGPILISSRTGTTPNFNPDHSPDSIDISQFQLHCYHSWNIFWSRQSWLGRQECGFGRSRSLHWHLESPELVISPKPTSGPSYKESRVISSILSLCAVLPRFYSSKPQSGRVRKTTWEEYNSRWQLSYEDFTLRYSAVCCPYSCWIECGRYA